MDVVLGFSLIEFSLQITVSSRQALASSLTDNSTETFWESDEEDRNKSKIIEISLTKLNYICKAIYVHIDNSRDIGVSLIFMVFDCNLDVWGFSGLKFVCFSFTSLGSIHVENCSLLYQRMRDFALIGKVVCLV